MAEPRSRVLRRAPRRSPAGGLRRLVLLVAVALPAPALADMIAHGPRDAKMIALTFDACSTRRPSDYDPRITRVLIRAGVPATIFIGGKWAREEARNVRALAANPRFELGNHSWSHPHLTRLRGARGVRSELERTQRQLLALTGARPTLFRPPYGEYDARVVRVADRLGLRTVMFDLPAGDPGRGATKQALVRWVVKRARPGSIVVMHINHRRFHTAEALPEIIAELRARGFTFGTVSDVAAACPADACTDTR